MQIKSKNYLKIPAVAFEFLSFVGLAVRKTRIASAKPLLLDVDFPQDNSLLRSDFFLAIILIPLLFFKLFKPDKIVVYHLLTFVTVFIDCNSSYFVFVFFTVRPNRSTIYTNANSVFTNA